jgi:hypothetical protein
VQLRVRRDCGAGAVLEQLVGSDWNGVVPYRASPPPEENERGLQGTGVFYGKLTGEFRVRCLPGTGERCEVETVVTELPRGEVRIILEETVQSPCGRTAFIARFNGIREDSYEAELTVEADCGAGVKVERFNHQRRQVRLNGGPETEPGPNFEVRAGGGPGGTAGSAKWEVKSSNSSGNAWFHITCLPSPPNTGSCKFKIVVRDNTV